MVAVERRGTVVGYYIPLAQPDQPADEALPSERVEGVGKIGSGGQETANITFEDPLWRIVGIGRSEDPTDVAANKHQYLAEAYAARPK